MTRWLILISALLSACSNMHIKVTAQIPMDKFSSEWENQMAAAQEYRDFLKASWADDLAPLVEAGFEVSVDIGITDKSRIPKSVEVGVEPYSPDAFNMMKKTRELLADEGKVWSEFQKSPYAIALYGG